MGEKRKWFDPDYKPLPVPTPLRYISSVSPGDIDEFFGAMRTNRIVITVGQLFQRLAAMTPERRLARNLKVFLGEIAQHDVNDVMEGLTTDERAALVALEVGRYSARQKETAQHLLSVPERYQLLLSVRGLFTSARRRVRTQGT